MVVNRPIISKNNKSIQDTSKCGILKDNIPILKAPTSSITKPSKNFLSYENKLNVILDNSYLSILDMLITSLINMNIINNDMAPNIINP